MSEALKVFGEIFLSFLCVAGAAFIANEFYELIVYRRKKAMLPVIVDARRFGPDEIKELVRVYSRLMKRREAGRLIGRIVIVMGEGSRISEDTLAELKTDVPYIKIAVRDDLLGSLYDIVE